MLKNILPFFLLLSSSFAFCQNFTWLRGSTSSSIAGTYGTQGVASAANDPGGRHGAATWTDAQGNMWLFGGEGYSSTATLCWLNDLWKYNPITNQWTWIRGSAGPNAVSNYGTQGVASPMNEPGAREFCASWIDAQGKFWLYAGDGFGATATFGRLSDLWKYDPLTNQWTWISGPTGINLNGVYGTQGVAALSNMPGARYWPATWVDNTGKFWVFGGRGYATANQGRLNDLWRFDPITNQWTWMKGAPVADAIGVYGTQGTAAAGNTPGARDRVMFFISNQGNLVLFGGQGQPNSASTGLLNDLWEYNVTTNNWTWLKGSQTSNPLSVYGTLGQAAAAVTPGGRASSAAWADMMGNYWVFGGSGIGTSLSSGRHSDLFMYNPNTNNWTWIKGPNLQFQNGNYGTQGVTAPTNIPGARDHNDYWRNTSSGYLWLFGGEGYDAASGFVDHMNDLWKFKVPCNPDTALKSVQAPVCSGATATFTAYNLYPSQVFWYTSPTSTTTVGSGSIFTTPALNSPTSNTVLTWYAGFPSCTNMPRAIASITVLALPQLSGTGPASLCPGQSGVMTASGSPVVLWQTGTQTSTLAIVGTTTPSLLSFTGTAANGCSNAITLTVGVYPTPLVTVGSTKNPSCTGETLTLTASGATSYTWNGTDVDPSIVVSPTISTSYTVVGTNQFGCTTTHSVTQFVVYCVGLKEEWNKDESSLVYPNPNTGVFIVKTNEPATFQVVNSAGQLVIDTLLEAGENKTSEKLPQGIYFYQIKTSTGNARSGKLLID